MTHWFVNTGTAEVSWRQSVTILTLNNTLKGCQISGMQQEWHPVYPHPKPPPILVEILTSWTPTLKSLMYDMLTYYPYQNPDVELIYGSNKNL